MAGWARKRTGDIDHPSTHRREKGKGGRGEGDVLYLAADDEPAILLGVVLGDVLEGEDLGHGCCCCCGGGGWLGWIEVDGESSEVVG